MNREIIIKDWKAEDRNTLKGFFTAVLPSGLIIHRLMLQESHGKRWIGLPSREYIINGETKYAKMIDFVDPQTAEKFKAQVLEALDKHRKQTHRPPAPKLTGDKHWDAL